MALCPPPALLYTVCSRVPCWDRSCLPCTPSLCQMWFLSIIVTITSTPMTLSCPKVPHLISSFLFSPVFRHVFDWLMIAYIALFSALLSRLTALACGSTWVTSFIARFLNSHWSGVLTALAWLVPHETAAVSAKVLCTPYNHAPCHFMQSHIRKVYACLAVTCHLHFGRMIGIFYVLLW